MSDIKPSGFELFLEEQLRVEKIERLQKQIDQDERERVLEAEQSKVPKPQIKKAPKIDHAELDRELIQLRKKWSEADAEAQEILRKNPELQKDYNNNLTTIRILNMPGRKRTALQRDENRDPESAPDAPQQQQGENDVSTNFNLNFANGQPISHL